MTRKVQHEDHAARSLSDGGSFFVTAGPQATIGGSHCRRLGSFPDCWIALGDDNFESSLGGSV
jgi:hypothetical protein